MDLYKDGEWGWYRHFIRCESIFVTPHKHLSKYKRKHELPHFGKLMVLPFSLPTPKSNKRIDAPSSKVDDLYLVVMMHGDARMLVEAHC